MIYTIKNEDIATANESVSFTFPKYTSQIINLANQNAQGTRANVVGQMSDLFQQFTSENNDPSIEKWKQWYLLKNPEAIHTASERIFAQVQNLQEALEFIDKEMVSKWVEDLLINKTFNGLYVQKAILAFLGTKQEQPYRLATSDEESQGIDGYVGETPYSVKPISYKTMNRLPEAIDVKMVYYEKNKTGLKIEVDE